MRDRLPIQSLTEVQLFSIQLAYVEHCSFNDNLDKSFSLIILSFDSFALLFSFFAIFIFFLFFSFSFSSVCLILFFSYLFFLITCKEREDFGISLGGWTERFSIVDIRKMKGRFLGNDLFGGWENHNC